MKIGGVLPVLYLPYHDDYSIDYTTLARNVDWLFESGADGVVLAMVSEIFRLADSERDKLYGKVAKLCAGRGPLIASVGAESTVQAVRHARAAQDAGASAIMSIPPVFTRCAGDEIFRYYESLLSATEIPVIVQDAGGFVGNALPVALQVSLFQKNPERIMFKPEAPPRGACISALREGTQGKARIFDGIGGVSLVEHHRRGIAGVMAGSDLPWVTVALWRALKTGDDPRAWRIHGPLAALMSMMHNLDAFITIGKFLLMKQGIFKNKLVRPPVGYVLDAETEHEVLRIFELLKKACE